ncbi:MAG: AAA family ATPase [Petrimonas sp.]|jgi:AAA+ superfamily predicted ATPase
MSLIKKRNYGCLSCSIILLIGALFFGVAALGHDETEGIGILVLLVSGVMVLMVLISLIAELISNSSQAQSKKEKITIKTHIDTAKEAYKQASNQIEKDILQNFINYYELNDQANKTEAIVNNLKNKISRKNNPKLISQLELHENKLQEIKAELKNGLIDIEKDLTDNEKEKYSEFCDSFDDILDCHKIWIITSSVLDAESKSSVTYSIKREEVNFEVGAFNFIKSSFDTPILKDLHGYSYYIYPKYIIKELTFADFEVFPINTIDIIYKKINFLEPYEDDIPIDTQIIEYRHKYVNKKGGRDRRYSYNPELPVVEYGEIQTEAFGLTFQISNSQSADRFVSAFNALKKAVDTTSKTEQVKISEEYFNQVNEVTEKLVVFYNELINDNEFITLLKKHLNQKDGSLEDDELVYILFCIDIKTCYDKLLIPIDFSTKESLGFNIFSKRALGLSQLKYYQLDDLIRISENSHDSMLNMMESTNLQGEATHIFLIADLLNVTDKQKMKQYMILMYRFASIIAKADGSISDTEQKWLKELLKLSELDKDSQEKEESNKNDDSYKIEDNEEALTKHKSEATERIYPSLQSNAQEELEALIGLTNVKEEIKTLANFIKIQQKREAKGLKTSQLSYHCVFTGNPGTGKTTVARIIAEIYKELGVLQKGHLVETDRSGLVAEYIGQTAVKTNKIINSALDGVLFIDEAYSLYSSSDNDYGKEAIATLLKRMEDNRDRLVVILAGYTNEMKEFIDSNSGLQSRFNRYIEFPDYSAEELYKIFEFKANEFDYTISDSAQKRLISYFNTIVNKNDENFGNARFVRNFFEKTLEQQANRLASQSFLTIQQLTEIKEEDVIIDD